MTKPIFIFYGDEPLLIEEAFQSAQSKYNSYSTIEFGSSSSLSELLNQVTMTGLFSSHFKIIARDPSFITKAVSDKEFATLKSLCDTIVANGHVLIIAMTRHSLDKRRKSVTLLKKLGELQEFKSFQDWELNKLYAWLQARIKQKGKSIQHDALEALVLVSGTQLSVLSNYIELLITYVGESSSISRQDIDALSADVSRRIFDFSEAIKSRSLSSALSTLKSVLAHGEDPIALLGLLSANIRLYLQILVGLDQNASFSDLSKTLGKHPFFIQKLAPSVQKSYTVSHLKTLLSTLNQCDIRIKSGAMSPKKALEIATIKVCS